MIEEIETKITVKVVLFYYYLFIALLLIVFCTLRVIAINGWEVGNIMHE